MRSLTEVTEIKPDVIVECHLDAKYYHYNPTELNDLANVSDNFTALTDCDDVIIINQATLDNACPTWDAEAESVNPKWPEHHQSGHLIKDKTCPIWIEESGSRVVHWRSYGDRQPGIMQLDLATLEPSADGHRYCLVALATVEVDKLLQVAADLRSHPKERRRSWPSGCQGAPHIAQ